MRAARRTAEEQYQMILECRQSGLTDCDWCRENGININTFYAWVGRARKEARYPISPAARVSSRSRVPSNEVVKVEILPDGRPRMSDDNKSIAVPLQQSSIPAIEIEAGGITFRFSGTVDVSLYEKTLLMIGGRL